jgi:hypothetical protein
MYEYIDNQGPTSYPGYFWFKIIDLSMMEVGMNLGVEVQRLDKRVNELSIKISTLSSAIAELKVAKKYVEDSIKNTAELEIKAYTENRELFNLKTEVKIMRGALLDEIKERLYLGKMYESRIDKLEEVVNGSKS